MSRGANLVLAGILLVVTIAIMSLVAVIFPLLVGPFAEVVLASDGAQAVGFDTGAALAVRIGAWVPGLMGLVIVLWFLFREVLFDARNTGGR
jgi:hypothetical protein